MKYLEDAFKFFGKHFMLALPFIIALILPNIIAGSYNAQEMTERLNEYNEAIASGNMLPEEIFGMLFEIMQPFFVLMGISIIVTFVLTVLVTPPTYGMINKALATGDASLNDFFSEFGKNFLKFFIYGIASILVWLVVSVIFSVIGGLFALVIAALNGVGTAAMVLGVVVGILIAIVLIFLMMVFGFLLSYWFPAMVVDDLPVFTALKKSIEVAKSYFWPTVGISLLISIGGGTAASVISMSLQTIPVVGVVLGSIPSAIAQFITIVFLMMVYRDKTGKNEIQDDNVSDLPNEFI